MEPVGVAVGRVGCCASPVFPRHVHVPVGPSSPRDPAGDVPIASPTSPLHHHIKKREERHGGMGMSNWEVTFGADGWMDGWTRACKKGIMPCQGNGRVDFTASSRVPRSGGLRQALRCLSMRPSDWSLAR
jgi:hypothetical protein